MRDEKAVLFYEQVKVRIYDWIICVKGKVSASKLTFGNTSCEMLKKSCYKSIFINDPFICGEIIMVRIIYSFSMKTHNSGILPLKL